MHHKGEYNNFASQKLNVMRKVLLIPLFVLGMPAVAQVDSLRNVALEEVVISSPKEYDNLRDMPMAVSQIGNLQLQQNEVTAIKSVASMVPNLFVPDYGSRLTSAIYIRGIGSRSGTSAVGLYVDNIPYIDKSAFDFNFYDIERVDVLRGPQGTLYGRNTMGGLIKVHTFSPLNHDGTYLNMGFATQDSHRRISLSHYHHLINTFALSAAAYYEGSNGFFRHSKTNDKVDGMEAGGGRIRGIWKPNHHWMADFNISYDYTDEGAYPYFYTGTLKGEESYPDEKGKITNNTPNKYRRGIFNAGLNLEFQTENFTLNAVTGFQNLSDRMFMDQDFLSTDIYTLEQKQRLNSLNEEITLKNKNEGKWQWVTGVNATAQWLKTNGPVNFCPDGVKWLQGIINGYMPDLSASGITSMGVTVNDETLLMDGVFKTPVLNTALFHQSTFHLSDALSATIGLRLDYEHTHLDYDEKGLIHYDFMMGSKKMPVSLKDQEVVPSYVGNLNRDYLQLLPKFAINYAFNKSNNLYVTVSKGFRSGGYNVQMFSDLLQGKMRNEMMLGIKQGTTAYLQDLASKGMPQMVIDMIIGNLDKMPVTELPEVSDAAVYKPEYSWNYEVGTHLSSANNKLKADVALFYVDTRNQQISRFSPNGFGRIMVNAGRSESYGFELSGSATMRTLQNQELTLNLNYGYTHAKFKEYDEGNGHDYSGNYVPFVPKHTLNASATYRIYTDRAWPSSVNLALDYIGTGKLYWTEANSASQKYYNQMNAHITLCGSTVNVNLWIHNLTNIRYNTFYFESMGRGFEQHNKPIQMGVDLQLHF